jgi:hypothetical protein
MTDKIASVYFAGFFDGEGYIGLLKRQRGKYTEYFVQLSIGQKDGAVMDWIKDNFGGNVYLVKRDGTFYWTSSNRNALKILKRIFPYLKYKKPQAQMAIEFFEGQPKRESRVSPVEMDRRESIYLMLKAEKKIFTKSTYVS